MIGSCRIHPAKAFAGRKWPQSRASKRGMGHARTTQRAWGCAQTKIHKKMQEFRDWVRDGDLLTRLWWYTTLAFAVDASLLLWAHSWASACELQPSSRRPIGTHRDHNSFADAHAYPTQQGTYVAGFGMFSGYFGDFFNKFVTDVTTMFMNNTSNTQKGSIAILRSAADTNSLRRATTSLAGSMDPLPRTCTYSRSSFWFHHALHPHVVVFLQSSSTFSSR